MIYEWKCATCDGKVEVQRTLDEYDVPPRKGERECKCPPKRDQWSKVYTSSTNWETLRDTGVLERLERHT